MINESDEPCDGCLLLCNWWHGYYNKTDVKLTPYALKKMKECPCEYCLVKVMCKKFKCILFVEHFENRTGQTSIWRKK